MDHESVLYGSLAGLYDQIYHWKDYPAESDRICQLLQEHGVPERGSVFELACGTGSHLASLRSQYRVAGLDLSESMLAMARAKLPGVELIHGDMTDFALNEPVDAILSLFSSIGHVYPEPRLQSAARCIRAALKDGGVALIEPWLTPEVFRPGRPSLQTFDGDDLKIARMTVPGLEGRVSRVDYHYLVARRDQDVKHYTERHDLYLYTRDEMTRVFEGEGFKVTWDEAGLMNRGLLIAHC